jgi:hypothetical protein
MTNPPTTIPSNPHPIRRRSRVARTGAAVALVAALGAGAVSFGIGTSPGPSPQAGFGTSPGASRHFGISTSPGGAASFGIGTSPGATKHFGFSTSPGRTPAAGNFTYFL